MVTRFVEKLNASHGKSGTVNFNHQRMRNRHNVVMIRSDSDYGHDE